MRRAPQRPHPLCSELGLNRLLPELTRLQCLHIRRRDATVDSTYRQVPAGTPAAIVNPVGSGAPLWSERNPRDIPVARATARIFSNPPFGRRPTFRTLPVSTQSGGCRTHRLPFTLAVPDWASGPVTLSGVTLCLLYGRMGRPCALFGRSADRCGITLTGPHSSFACWPQHSSRHRAWFGCLTGWHNPALFAAVVQRGL